MKLACEVQESLNLKRTRTSYEKGERDPKDEARGKKKKEDVFKLLFPVALPTL